MRIVSIPAASLSVSVDAMLAGRPKARYSLQSDPWGPPEWSCCVMVVESRVRVSSASHTDTDATRRLRAPRRPRIDGLYKISSAKISCTRFISDNPQKTTKFPDSYILDKVPPRFAKINTKALIMPVRNRDQTTHFNDFFVICRPKPTTSSQVVSLPRKSRQRYPLQRQPGDKIDPVVCRAGYRRSQPPKSWRSMVYTIVTFY